MHAILRECSLKKLTSGNPSCGNQNNLIIINTLTNYQATHCRWSGFLSCEVGAVEKEETKSDED